MRMVLVGDVMLGRLVNSALKKEQAYYPWGDTLDIFKNADFCMCNLECVITRFSMHWSPVVKAFHFQTDPKNIEVLKSASIDAVSLANNHVLDFNYEAMMKMLQILERAGIWYAGAGKDLAQASAVAIPEVQHFLFGILAFTDNEPEWEAEKDKPGVYYVPLDFGDVRAKRLFQVVKEAKYNVNFLIMSAHWGPNWGYDPPEEQIPFAKALIDAGADVVYGHSGHIFRGMEIYKGKPIFYCTGNFIDDYAVDTMERNDQSFIFSIEISKRGKLKEIILYPTVIRNFQAMLAVGTEKKEIVDRMTKLCERLGTKVKWHPRKSFLEIEV